MTGFLLPSVMAGRDWRALELCIGRLLLHCGWNDIQVVGGTGDKGADILAARFSEKAGRTEGYLVQVKAVSGGRYVGTDAIEQALRGQSHFGANIAVVATNGEFTKSAYARRDNLNNQGFRIRLWNGSFLEALLNKWPDYAAGRRELRSYQRDAVVGVERSFSAGCQKCLLVIATGLGKTVIAASLADALYEKGLTRTLVLCHTVDLAHQLQQAFWRDVSKGIATRIFTSGNAPVPIDGINFGLYQSLYGYLGGLDPDAFDLIIVDEAHHALANAFSTCIQHLEPKLLLGMTATPWRGDGESIEKMFGDPVMRLSLIDGMRMGYLAKVDYRLMCDNINWGEVSQLATTRVSIKDLNKRLFVPQRDEAVIGTLLEVIGEFDDPRVAVFSPSTRHADSFARKLVAAGIPAANLSIDDKLKRRRLLLDFATGGIRAITAVDILNEGIDVPNVNILVFLRATHSRRIFVQQLGRGLRLAEGKTKVIVLDFVTDVRRLSALVSMDREARKKPPKGVVESVHLEAGVVAFSDERAGQFIDTWLGDVASLEDEDDAAMLVFPTTRVE